MTLGNYNFGCSSSVWLHNKSLLVSVNKQVLWVENRCKNE